MKADNVILFDMDGTLCDWFGKIIKDLNTIKGPDEPEITEIPKGGIKKYLRTRLDVLMQRIDWWVDLEPLPLGMDLWNIAGELGFERMILTQGPRRNPEAWTGKKIWVDKFLGIDTKVTITRDKSIVDGAILIDDWPLYVLPWLQEHPSRSVILPQGPHNTTFKHKRSITYTGNNRDDVITLIKSHKKE